KQGFYNGLNYIDEKIMSLDVSQFVSNHRFEESRGSVGQKGCRDDDHGLNGADDHRHMNPHGGPEADVLPDIHLIAQTIQKGKILRVDGDGIVFEPLEAPEIETHSDHQENHPDDVHIRQGNDVGL